MLAVEDALDGLRWAERIGGLPALIARSEANLRIVAAWVERTPWVEFLAAAAGDPLVDLDLPRSSSIPRSRRCRAPARPLIKNLVARLEAEGVAYDIASYRDAPPGSAPLGRRHGGARDLAALLPWLDWAFRRRSSAVSLSADLSVVRNRLC